MPTWYAIRRKSDKLYFGKNLYYHTTGNYKPRQGFDISFPPRLYSDYGRALTACVTNLVLLNEPSELEIYKWNTSAMRKVSIVNRREL